MAGGEVQDAEALGQSHKVLEQAYAADCKSPDLADQVANHSEPTAHNYFFEPYSAGAWSPQLVHKHKILPYPSVIASAYDAMASSSFSGLLQELHHAWVSVDNTLFLWDYTRDNRVTVFEGMEQVICAVGVAVPIPGVFKPFVKHVLVVATASEMRLLAVLPEADGSIRLGASKLSISTDDCIVRKIVSTTDGRIFFGGSDGALHEFVYDAEEGMLHQLGIKRKCRKESHAQSYAQFLPSFFRTFAGAGDATGRVVDLQVDHERRILYVLQEPAFLSVYDLGTEAGADITLVTSKNLEAEAARFCQRNQRNLTSCPEPRLFATTSVSLTSLSIVARDESSSIHVIAVSATGIRFYLSTFSPGFLSSALKRPAGLDLVHIRLPPPTASLDDAPDYHRTEGLSPALLPGKSPSQVHAAYYRHGVFLAVNGGPDEYDQVLGLTKDLTARHTQDANASMKVLMRESISCDSCQGKVSAVEEFQPAGTTPLPAASSVVNDNGKRSRSSSLLVNTDAPPAMLHELVTQVVEPVRHFLVLTNAGLHIFKKVRPIDQLFRVLHATKDVKKQLAHFVKCFGHAETCAMLFAIACGALAAQDALWTEPSGSSMKSDDHIVAMAMQAIFDFGGAPNVSAGGQPQSNHRFVMTDDMGMSAHHDGLVLFVARLLRPLWAGPTVAAPLERVRNVLFRLQQVLETHYRTALASHGAAEPSAANALTRQLVALVQEATPAAVRQDNAVRAEQASIRCLYLFASRAIQVLSLVLLAPTPGLPLSLPDLVTTTAGWDALKGLLSRLTAGHKEALVASLRTQCPLFFKDTDAAACHGYQQLDAAASCATVEDRTACLVASLNHFKLAAKSWKTAAHVLDLEAICASYFTLGYLDGIVALAFATAPHFPTDDDSRRICYGYVVQCVQFFSQKATEDGSVCAAPPVEWTSPEAREACLAYLLEKLLAVPDSYFHSVLYTWLYTHDERARLIALPGAKHRASVEAFLQAKDQDLLVQMYLVADRYVDAAHVLWSRATSSMDRRPIAERIDLISRAKSILAAANDPAATAALHEVTETLQVLTLQLHIHTELAATLPATDAEVLGSTIVAVSPLYNDYAAKYRLWPECLRILCTCHSEDVATIELLWKRLLYSLIPLSVANDTFNQWLRTACEAVDVTPKTTEHLEHASWMSHVQAQVLGLKELFPSKTFPVELLVHEIEHAWMWYKKTTGVQTPRPWIAPLFLEAGVSYAALFGAYLALFQKPAAPAWRLHLLEGLYQLVGHWLDVIRGVAPRELQLEFATATPVLTSACEDIVVDLQGLLADGNPTKAELVQLFRRLKVDIAATKSTYA
ncbi:nuclear pore complex protein [Achlya hypogyna]|uniref:Nuclear pore complex protein n=1 Tax=Achlya hypogyna TaxID=1202772 RepID=A0A1V9ZDK1_ACHHY|nr:nuclear pore complex protein [Achlya hypogyna]